MQTLAKDNEWLNSKFSVDYQLLRDNKKEKNILMVELEHFKDKASRLQEELQKKTHGVEEGRQLRAQLQQQIVWNDTEMSENKQCLKEYEEDNNLLMDKIIGLKLKNNELMVNHGGKSGEVAEGRDSITSPGKTLLLFFFIVFLLNSIFYLYNFKS